MLTYVRFDGDWEAWYLGGTLLVEGHVVSAMTLAYALQGRTAYTASAIEGARLGPDGKAPRHLYEVLRA